MILSLVERGITDIPYANRPLGLLFSQPARLGPDQLRTYHVLHTAYFAGVGCLVFLLGRRLSPERPLLGFLAGIIAATWAPLDYQRLNVIQPYGGLTFGACLALVLLVESWRRGQALLLHLAALAAFVSIRAYEGSAALLLLGGPLLLLWLERRPPRAWTWLAEFECVVLLALALTALPFLMPSRAQAYQQMALGGTDLDAARVLARLLEQYQYHLLPLLTIAPEEFRTPAVGWSLAAFAAAFAAVALSFRSSAPEPVAPRRARLALLMALGLLLAGLGYGVLVLSGGLVRAARTQFFSGPGIGLFLAATFALLASAAPRAWRLPLLGLLGAWVAAAAVARTVTVQGFWDKSRVHAKQVRLLRELAGLAPHFKPNTYVILIDEAETFDTHMAFRHALLYVYPGEAIGHPWRKWDFLYPIRFTPEGLLSEPVPGIREAWRAPVTRHRFEEIVVLRQPAQGPLELVEAWPAQLPPLPPGARYDPRARIVPGPAPPQRRLLGALRSLASPARRVAHWRALSSAAA